MIENENEQTSASLVSKTDSEQCMAAGEPCNELCSKQTSNWQVMQLLGKGGFASCYKIVANDRNGKQRPYALKLVRINGHKKCASNEKMVKCLHDEIDVHKSLMHKNIVRYRCNSEKGDYIRIILEYCNGGNISKRIQRQKKLSPPEAQHYIKQIISALEYLHSKSIIHRDIKNSNIFLHVPSVTDIETSKTSIKWHDVVCKVGDFGLAVTCGIGQSIKTNSSCGTPGYMSPEIFKQKRYSDKSDMWALGCCLYAMLVGHTPFHAKTPEEIKELVMKYEYQIPEYVDQDARQLIKLLLNHDPNGRPTSKEALFHPFIVKRF